MNLKHKKRKEVEELFKKISVQEKNYLSFNKRFQILQFHWGIVSEPRTFRDINRLVNIRNAKQVYNEMMGYFGEKGYINVEANCGVYFIRGEIITHRVKIGQSTNAKHRRNRLQTGSADKLYVEHVVPIDDKNRLEEYQNKLHAWFDQWRIHGEWFQSIPDEELEPIYNCRNKEEVDVVLAKDPERAEGKNKLSGNEDPLGDGEDDEFWNEEEIIEHKQRLEEENGRKFIAG